MTSYYALLVFFAVCIGVPQTAAALPFVTQNQYVYTEAYNGFDSDLDNKAYGIGNVGIRVDANVWPIDPALSGISSTGIFSHASQSSDLFFGKNSFTLLTDNRIYAIGVGSGVVTRSKSVSNYSATIVADATLHYDWSFARYFSSVNSPSPSATITGNNGDILLSLTDFGYPFDYHGILNPGIYTLSINLAGTHIECDGRPLMDTWLTSNFTASTVPEPATLFLVSSGIFVVFAVRRNRRS